MSEDITCQENIISRLPYPRASQGEYHTSERHSTLRVDNCCRERQQWYVWLSWAEKRRAWLDKLQRHLDGWRGGQEQSRDCSVFGDSTDSPVYAVVPSSGVSYVPVQPVMALRWKVTWSVKLYAPSTGFRSQEENNAHGVSEAPTESKTLTFSLPQGNKSLNK